MPPPPAPDFSPRHPSAGDRPASPWPQRLYLLVVSAFTAWVGLIGFWRPAEILRALPWPLPPLHARVIGALYLSATVFLWLAAASRQRLAARAVLVIALVWTGSLALVSLLHWRSFDPVREQVWFWAVAYGSFPPLAAALLRGAWRAPVPARQVLHAEVGLRWLLLLQGVLLLLLSAALGLWPGDAGRWWPWPLPALLAQVYAGPLLGLGVGSLWLAHTCSWPEALPPMVGQGVFAGLAAVASSWHAGAFVAGSWSQAGWWLGLTGLGLTALAVLVLGRPRAPARAARLQPEAA